MIYRDFKGERLSALGFGAMRLPMDGKAIDEPEAIKIIRRAHEGGVNYFDTAYSYIGGQSELVLGKALKTLPRESFNIASKFPGHELRDDFTPAPLFEHQLRKCGVEYFDYYLLHNLYGSSYGTYTDAKWGIVDYLLEQKERGRIRHFGFSTHALPELMTEFLDRYGEHMEFCQIQLNWLDWVLQDGKRKYELLTERGIPVWVMEPVRGGALCKLKDEDEAALRALRPDASIASWGFRWLQGLPNVCVTLSGMSTYEQVEDNINTYSDEKPLTDAEQKTLAKIADGMLDMLPCTSCRYCCKECPQELDIPTLLKFYNDCRFTPSFAASMAVEAMPPEKRPAACLKCGNCKKVCPQGIDIPEALRHFAEIYEKLPKWSETSKERAKQKG